MSLSSAFAVEEKTNYRVIQLDDVSSTRNKILKTVRRKLPILKWLPAYRWREYAVADFIAGITVWLCAIPASMGDASIAGLSPEYGLYSAYVGAFIYLFMGSVKELIIGPQAVLSLLSFQICGSNYPDCVILVGFYSGILHLLFGLLNLGFLVSFISEPVTVGFTAGAALLIASGQVKGFLGIKGSSAGSNLIPIWTHITDDFSTIRLGDSILGISCVLVLVILFKLKDIGALSRWKKYLHILSLSRNALVMIVCSLLGFALTRNDAEAPFYLIGNIRSGFPEFQLPHFKLVHPDNRTVSGNGTSDGVFMSESETLKFLSSGPLVISFIAILQNVAIGKKFNGKVDATQELLSLGVVNLVGSGFFDCIPTSASFSRSAVNASSGVKSHFAGFLSGVLMLLSLGFLAPYFKYIPKSTLSSIIIAAMIFMIDFHTIWRLWKLSKLDLLSCILTLVTSVLLGMEYGILIGVGVSILIILLKALRPTIKTEYRLHIPSNVHYVFIWTEQGLNFPSATYVIDQVTKNSRPGKKIPKNYRLQHLQPNLSASDSGEDNGHVKNGVTSEVTSTLSSEFPVVVLACQMWTKYDYTTLNAVVNLVDNLSKKGSILIFYQIPEVWPDLLCKFGLEHPLVARNMSELDSILMELGNLFIGPPRAGLRDLNLNLASRRTSPDGQDGNDGENDGQGQGRLRNSKSANGGLSALEILRRTFASDDPNSNSNFNFNSNSDSNANVNSNLNHRTIAGGEIERARARERLSFNFVRKKYSVQVED